MRIAPLADKAVIRAFLNRDRALTAYALGDLDDALWPQSHFWGAWQHDALVAVLLIFRGFDPPVLTAYGVPDGIEAIFADVALPKEVYYLIPEALEEPLSRAYTRPDAHREWRMALEPDGFVASSLNLVTRIQPDQAAILAALYQRAAITGEAIVAFSPEQIAQGRFYGVWVSGDLVAAAGTHVWSAAERVTAIGNVFTRPDCRGKGYATACVAGVVADALSAGMDTIVLNTRQDNAPALRVYDKLGFRRVHIFLEGPGLRHPG